MTEPLDRLARALRRLADGGALTLALCAAFWVRFLSGLVPPPPGDPPWGVYAAALPVVIGLGLVGFQAGGAYAGRAGELRQALRGAGVALLLLLAATFLYREESYSRLLAGAFAAALPPLVVGGRLAVRRLERAWRAPRRALLVGAEPALTQARELLARADVSIAAEVGLDDATPADLAARARASAADEVWLALPPARAALLPALDQALAGCAVEVRVALDLGELASLRSDPDLALDRRVAVLSLRQGPGVGLDGLTKRAVDVVLGAALLVVLSPVLALIALAVRLTSPGPVVYRQERMGWGGRRFVMFKFRTMHEGHDGPTRTARDDPRRTRVGGLLRRTSLDELPQLVNVVMGDMSLVGPRPERIEHFAGLEAELPGFMLRHAVPAGMTGWAQVHGLRGDAPVRERLRYDLEYVRRWSLGLDLRILVLTAVRGFVHENAF